MMKIIVIKYESMIYTCNLALNWDFLNANWDFLNTVNSSKWDFLNTPISNVGHVEKRRPF